MTENPVLELRCVVRIVDGVTILEDVSWAVSPGQHWVLLGPNGSGKTTLMRIASMWVHPSQGSVKLLGRQLGHTDVRCLRQRVGLTSAALADQLRPRLTAIEAVMTAKHGALEPWWHSYDREDRSRALEALDRVGCGHRAGSGFGTLSSGERQRVLLARALSSDPDLILLDEPNAGLDLAGREQLIGILGDLAADPDTPPLVLVTHHTDEIPSGFTHGLLLRGGRVLTQGRIEDVLTDRALSECFGMPLELSQANGRWLARASGARPAATPLASGARPAATPLASGARPAATPLAAAGAPTAGEAVESDAPDSTAADSRAAARDRNVVLTGFMGSGKTTVGGILAARLGLRLVDTDSMIEALHGPIPTIVADAGWAAFRAIERKTARRLADETGLVISTGGRLMLDPVCAACLEPGGDVVWLKADPAAIVERLLTAPGADPSSRPLLVADGADPHEVVTTLLQERHKSYARYRSVDTTHLSPEEAADAVQDLLSSEVRAV